MWENSLTKLSTTINTSAEEFIDNAGNIHIKAKNFYFEDEAIVKTDYSGPGGAGNITSEASEEFILSGESAIKGNPISIDAHAFRYFENSGGPGNTTISAKNITLAKGICISTGTGGSGNGATVRFNASESIIVRGHISTGITLGIKIAAAGKDALAGNTGDLEITARDVSISEGTNINLCFFPTDKVLPHKYP